MIQTSASALLLPFVFLILLVWNVNTPNNIVSASLVPGLEEDVSAIEGRSLTSKKRHTKGHTSVRKSRRKGKKKTKKGKKKQDDDDFPLWALANYDKIPDNYYLPSLDDLNGKYKKEFTKHYNEHGLSVHGSWAPRVCCVVIIDNGDEVGIGISSTKHTNAILEPTKKHNASSTCTPDNTLNGAYDFKGFGSTEQHVYRKLSSNDFKFTVTGPGYCKCGFDAKCPALVRKAS